MKFSDQISKVVINPRNTLSSSLLSALAAQKVKCSTIIISKKGS